MGATASGRIARTVLPRSPPPEVHPFDNDNGLALTIGPYTMYALVDTGGNDATFSWEANDTDQTITKTIPKATLKNDAEVLMVASTKTNSDTYARLSQVSRADYTATAWVTEFTPTPTSKLATSASFGTTAGVTVRPYLRAKSRSRWS